MIKPKNILIVRTDRIGDVVLTLPLASFLKKNFPGIKVSFLVREYTRACVSNNPFIDNVLVLKEKDGGIIFWENIRQLKKHNFDSCIVVFPVLKIALLMVLSAIKLRIGTGYRWYSFLFNRKVYEHRKHAERHELEYNINLLRVFGLEGENINKSNVQFGLNPSAASVQKIEHLLSQNKVDTTRPFLIIHPGSGGSAVDLPVESFRKLTNLLVRDLNVQIIITGNEKEKKVCNELIVNNTVRNFAGELSLEEFIALISKSELLIANSTGPIHLAASLGKKVIGFYPKIKACSARRWGPYTEKSIVFEPKTDCHDCSREQCQKLRCMESIDINEVFDNIKLLWKVGTTEK